jgi:LPXTG-site transpeptidase (sortase) family protein
MREIMSKKNKIRAAVIAALLGITIILGVIVFTSTTPKEPNLVDIEPLPDPEVKENQIEPTHHSEPHIEPTSTPAPIPTEGPIPTETSKLKQNYKEDPTDAFSLVVGDSQIGIAYGVDETTLDESPGWMENSAFPGEDGVCVIYGHRNRNHLRALRDVEIGDTLILKTSKGNFKYTVETIEILDKNKALTLPVVDGKCLMISTCYPFHYLGSAPKKYVVIAKLT